MPSKQILSRIRKTLVIIMATCLQIILRQRKGGKTRLFVTAIEEPDQDEESVTTTERRIETSSTPIPWSRSRRTRPTRRSSYTNYPVYQVVENRDEG